MEGLIIWLIILAVAIYNSKRKAKPKSARQRPQNYQQQSYQRPQGYRQQGYRQQSVQQAQGYQTRTNVNPNMAQMQAEMARKQQELKNRLQQKPMQQKNDIMSRAVANVKENEVDELAKSSELMNQVNDLMIMGYQADLSFARDFVAEGIDMLNSYEIPEF